MPFSHWCLHNLAITLLVLAQKLRLIVWAQALCKFSLCLLSWYFCSTWLTRFSLILANLLILMFWNIFMNLPLTKGFYMCIGLNIDIYMDCYYRCISTKGLLQNLEQTESNSLGGSFYTSEQAWFLKLCNTILTVYRSKIHI